MAVLYTAHFVQFLDDNGDPLAGGKLYTYAAGTTTLKATYTTSDGSVQNTNPIVLDSAGRAVLFIDGAYKFTLTDSDDVLIRTTDNITSFTATGEAASAYFEEFSGDGSTLEFTTSDDLGTDEKLIMVYVDNGLQEHSTNGTFASDTGWTKGSGWSIGSGVATATGAISTAISQSTGVAITQGQPYVVTMTITRDAGSLTPSLGGTAGTARSSAGTYSEIIIAGSTQTLAFTGSSFTGTLDNVTVKPVASTGFDLLPTSGYTINGTTLTLATAPASGTNNIQVWAPSLLSANAAASAAAAAASANTAATYASFVITASAGATDVSTSSVTIGTGSKTFTVSSGKSFTAGMYLTVMDQADSNNYMNGFVTSYSSTTLEMTILAVGGSGTISAWNIFPTSQTTSVSKDGDTMNGALGVVAGSVSAAGLFIASDTNTGMYSSGADTLDWATGGTAAMQLTSGQVMKFNSGFGSVATAYGVRAWVNFNGSGTVAIRGSGNVSSVTDNGTGDYTVNLTAAMPDTNYAVVSGAPHYAASSPIVGCAPSSVSAIAVLFGNPNPAAAYYDSPQIQLVVVR